MDFPLRFRTLATLLLAGNLSWAQEPLIQIDSHHVAGSVSPLLTGACIEDVNHEIYGGLYSQMIFGESFQEPAPSPAIKNFAAYGGLWIVQDGVVRVNGAGGPKLVSNHAPFLDGAAGVDVLFADRNSGLGTLLVRVNKPGIGADRFIGYEISLDPAGQFLSLSRHRNNFEPIDEIPCKIAIGKWIALQVRLEGPIIEVSVDGTIVLRHHESREFLGAGAVAVRGWRGEASFRNLWVKTSPSRETLPIEQPEMPVQVSRMWKPVVRGGAVGHFSITDEKPFIGTQSQQISFDSGQGEIGIENQGLNHWGMNFIAGKNYEGYVWVRANTPSTLLAALESRDGGQRYAEQAIAVRPGDWQRIELALTPKASDTAGRFSLMLKQPGALTIGHCFLQPGEWGRFKGLPVRRDVAEGLIKQGITLLRYGGSMVNERSYQWKKMIGPRDRRPPYHGTWYPYSTNGWGIVDFLSFCESAGFEYVPAFNFDQSPADMADFIDYAKAPAHSPWGDKRAADGHPEPYHLHYMELGNEERVDEKYAEKFESLATAIWAKDPKMILVVGDFAYGAEIADPFHFDGAASGITTLAAHQRILRLAKAHDAEVWFDVHVGTDKPVPVNHSLRGMLSFSDALDKIADGAKHRTVVFEFNAGNHAMKRAIANALAIAAIERDGRIPMACSANCLQPDQQNDNDWDQGLLFLNPSRVWLQPPGYLTQMLASHYQPNLVQCTVSADPSGLVATAATSKDGKTMVIQVVNPGEQQVPTTITLAGFSPTRPTASVTELSGPFEAINTAENPESIIPRQTDWKHEMKHGTMRYEFPPRSVTLLEFH